MFDTKKLAAAYEAKLIEYRRHIHEHPELSFKEKETSKFIKERLAAIGMPTMDGIRENSVVGVLETGRPGKTIAYRADFDALPIEENNFDLPFRSKNPGVMHACGHDAHTAILLCLAEAFMSIKSELSGKLIFLFQQAEEDSPGGAKWLVEDGAIDDADAVFGLHVEGHTPTGSISTMAGPTAAAVDSFQLIIKSPGCHGAHPNLAPDPIACGAMLVNEFQYIVSRYRDPLLPLVITVGKFAGGSAENIIPKEVELLTTIRTYDAKLRSDVEKWIKNAIERICSMRGCEYELDFIRGYPALINTEEPTEIVLRAAERLGYGLHPCEQSMGAEDFAFYAQAKPACMFSLGCHEETDSHAHTPDFRIDESCLKIGLECMLEIYKVTNNQ